MVRRAAEVSLMLLVDDDLSEKKFPSSTPGEVQTK
jgi:hypothetical protein